jgi:hypothetical protein
MLDKIGMVDYIKLSEMKNVIMAHLDKMGLKEQVRVINDEDLSKVMYLMSLLGEQLKSKETDSERIEMLISYIICLWVKMIVDYGVELKEL